MHGSVWLLHNLSLVFVSGFGGKGGRELFVGKVMGIYHPLLHELARRNARERDGRRKNYVDAVTTVNAEPSASLW